MASPINKPDDKFKVQTEQMNLAFESVDTEDQARDLINGRMQDAFLLKIKVDVENRSGVLMVLVSIIKKKILQVYSVIGNSPMLRKVHTFEDFQQLSRDFVEIMKVGGIDKSVSDLVGSAVHKSLVTSVIENFIPSWEKRDATNTINLLQQSIIKNVRANRVKLTAEAEKISSVKFRYKNPMQGIVIPIPPPVDDEVVVEELESKEQLPYEKLIEDTAKNFSKELLCESILSPVSGIEFDDLMEGQEILFKLPFTTSEDKTTAKAMDATDKEGKLLPVIGKFIRIVNGRSEYHILAEGPSNTILHSIEERPVRIATPKKLEKKKDVKASTSSNMNLLIVAGAVIFFLVLMILVLI